MIARAAQKPVHLPFCTSRAVPPLLALPPLDRKAQTTAHQQSQGQQVRDDTAGMTRTSDAPDGAGPAQLVLEKLLGVASEQVCVRTIGGLRQSISTGSNRRPNRVIVGQANLEGLEAADLPQHRCLDADRRTEAGPGETRRDREHGIW